MSPTIVALLGFAAWTLVLVLGIGIYRSLQVMTADRAANSFLPSGTDLPPFGMRLTRVHANCYEFLPVAAAVLLCAVATGRTAVTDDLALIFLGARLAQSLVHLASTSVPAVLLRFLFFAAQVLILLWWILRLFQALSTS